MVGYFYDNDNLNSKEWGETIEIMSKWHTEANEYKEKYEELLEKYNKLWDEYKERFEDNTFHNISELPNVWWSDIFKSPWFDQRNIYTTSTTNKL